MASEEPPMKILVRTNDSFSMRGVESKFAEPLGEPVVADCTDCFPCSFGEITAVASTDAVYIVSTATGAIIAKLDEAKVANMMFSPKGTFLVTMRVPDAKSQDGNLALYTTAGGNFELKTRVVQSKWPAFTWTPDESFAIRDTTNLYTVHDGNLDSTEPLCKLDLQLPKTATGVFEIAPSQPLVGIFRPKIANKTQQAWFKLFRLPNIREKDELMTINLSRADDASIAWSASGNAATVTVKKETDASGKSYYGTTTLMLVDVRKRESKAISVGKDEAIHDSKWSPTTDEFIVIHGTMPRNKATLYNGNGVSIYSFGESPRNIAHWAPNGKFFVMGGIGNLAGEFQFYDRENLDKNGGALGSFTEKSSVQEWSPCSRYLLCSTIFSRLRVDNKLVVWKHNGERSFEQKFTQLHSADYVSQPGHLFKPRAASPVKKSEAPAKPKAYVPPNRSAGAAAALARPAYGAAPKAKPSGPIGATLAEEPKKRKKR